MKKMDILKIVRMLAIIVGILLSLAIVILIFTDFLVKKPKKEEQKIEDTFASDVYGFYKDGKWRGNVAFGYSANPLEVKNQTWSISSSVIGRSDLK